MNKSGLIIAESSYPVGSLSIRIRMWAKGFIENSISIKILIVTPNPTWYSIENSEKYVIFALPITFRSFKNKRIKYLYQIYFGVIYLIKYLIKNNDFSFVILTRPNILIGIVVLLFCKVNKIKIFFDKGDEDGRLIDKENNSFLDYLAKQNQNLFSRYILPKVNVLFVVSSYLETKYKQLFPKLKIKRCLPALIDYKEYLENENIDITDILKNEIDILKSDKPIVLYAGSCERTNGLYFFLENAAQLLLHQNISFKIVLIFVAGDSNVIKQYCKTLHITEYVTFLNPVLPKYMPAIYKAVDILVLPEQGAVIANAGFPGKTGEYLASGKAIISTIFSDLTDYLEHGHNAMLSPIGDKETYSINLKMLIEDAKLRKLLGLNAAKTAKTYFDYNNGVLRYIEEL